MASRVFRPSRIIAVVLVIGAAAWVASQNLGPQADESGAPAQTAGEVAPPPVPLQKVGVSLATAEEHHREIVLSCVTEADHRAKAVARGAGVITDLNVKRGNAVMAGETMATISDEGRMAAVQQAQALLDQRMAEYDANKRLIDQGNAPKNQLPALEAGVAAAKAAVSAAQAELEKTSVKAPIGGVIDAVPIQVGQAVQVGTEVATIVDPDPMLAVGAVNENRRNSVRIGQNATVRFIDGSTRNGTVNFVEPQRRQGDPHVRGGGHDGQPRRGDRRRGDVRDDREPRPGDGDGGAALGAGVFRRRPSWGALGRCRQQGGVQPDRHRR